MCTARAATTVELVEVDLRKGLYEGHRSNVAPSTSTATRYGEDAAARRDRRTRRRTTLPSRASSRRPRWSTTTWARASVDSGLHYRRFVNLYAIERDLWDEHFVDTQQSTVFHARRSSAATTSTLTDACEADNVHVTPASREAVATANGPARVRDGGARATPTRAASASRQGHAVRRRARRRRARAAPPTGCTPTTTTGSSAPPTAASDPVLYRAQFCAGVAGGSTRSLVWRKQTSASGPALPVCHGMPVGAGMILANGSIFFSQDPGDAVRPVDVQCRAACEANPECAMAHSMIETFDTINLAHNAAAALAARAAAPAAAHRAAAAADAARAAARWHNGYRVWSPQATTRARGLRRRLGRALPHVLRLWRGGQRLAHERAQLALADGILTPRAR